MNVDPQAVLNNLPPLVQAITGVGLGVSAVLMAVANLLRPGKPKAAEPVASAVAVVAPLLTPEQVRLAFEGGAQALRLLHELRDTLVQAEKGIGRVEDAALKAAGAAKDVEDAVARAQRR